MTDDIDVELREAVLEVLSKDPGRKQTQRRLWNLLYGSGSHE